MNLIPCLPSARYLQGIRNVATLRPQQETCLRMRVPVSSASIPVPVPLLCIRMWPAVSSAVSGSRSVSGSGYVTGSLWAGGKGRPLSLAKRDSEKNYTKMPLFLRHFCLPSFTLVSCAKCLFFFYLRFPGHWFIPETHTHCATLILTYFCGFSVLFQTTSKESER